MRGVIHGINKNRGSIHINLNRCGVHFNAFRAGTAYCYNSEFLGDNASFFADSEAGGVSG